MAITEQTYKFNVCGKDITIHVDIPPEDEISMELYEGEYILSITKVEEEK